MSAEHFSNAMQALQEIADHVAVPMKGGKHYTMVKDRVEIFRREFGDDYGINTKVDYQWGFDQGAPVVANAVIADRGGRVVASGWAVEYVGSTKLTDASPVEVAETSAIGRALACFGLHGGEYASLNEVEAHQRKDDFRHEAPLTKPVERQTERQRPASQWYVPTDDEAMWAKPEAACHRITLEIDGINTTHELGRYWSELKPAMDLIRIDEQGQDIIAEIKAAFATRHNYLGSQR
jgi:hypothetical protein